MNNRWRRVNTHGTSVTAEEIYVFMKKMRIEVHENIEEETR